MSTFQDKEAEASTPKSSISSGDNQPLNAVVAPPKKPFVRRRPGGMKPPTVEANPPRVFQPYEPRPRTSHDRYLTYDAKGKLITHTVYHAPPSTKPVVLTFPKSKKYKSSDSTGEQV